MSKSKGFSLKRMIHDALLLIRAGIIVYFYVTRIILTVPLATKWRLLKMSYAKYGSFCRALIGPITSSSIINTLVFCSTSCYWFIIDINFLSRLDVFLMN